MHDFPPSSTGPPADARAPAPGSPAIGVHDGIEGLAAEWDALADRLAASPFLSPGWLAAWIDAFGRGRLEVLAARRDGRLVGVLPLLAGRGVVRSPTNFHTPEFDVLAEDGEAAERLVGAAIGRRGAHRVDLAFLAPGSRAELALGAVLPASGRAVIRRTIQRSPYLPLTGSWEELRAGLSKSFQSKLTRFGRRLGELGDVRFTSHAGPEGLDELLADAWRIEGSGWKESAGTAIASRPETRRFYERIARWAAERGWLSLGFLEVAGERVAVELALEARGRHYMLKGGYRPEFGRYRVGHQLCAAEIRRACERGLEVYEFLGDAAPHKLAWTSEVRPLARVQAFASSPRGRVSHLAWRHGRPLAREVLARAGRRS